MKFLYQYFYTFFQLHQRDQKIGRNNNLPWFSTLLQLSLGFFCMLIGGYWAILWLIQSKLTTGGIQKYHVNFLTGTIFGTLYYLLFSYLKVDRQTGLTPLYCFEVTKRKRIVFWLIWIGSILFVALLGFLRHHL
jgi:hypothetical protein